MWSVHLLRGARVLPALTAQLNAVQPSATRSRPELGTAKSPQARVIISLQQSPDRLAANPLDQAPPRPAAKAG